jgi:8-oxo-dGTP pyrophosphatase MutT (NUDIX family)
MNEMDNWKGDRMAKKGAYLLTSLGVIALPDFRKITSVAVIPIDEHAARMVAVSLRDRGIDLPGGHVQLDDRSPEDTAQRECWEEAKVHISNLRLLDVVQSSFYGDAPDQLTYMLIYRASVSGYDKFIPSEEVVERLVLGRDEFLARCTSDDSELLATWIDAAMQ